MLQKRGRVREGNRSRIEFVPIEQEDMIAPKRENESRRGDRANVQKHNQNSVFKSHSQTRRGVFLKSVEHKQKTSATDLTVEYTQRGLNEFKRWVSEETQVTPNHIGAPIALTISDTRLIEFLSAFCIHAATVFNDYTHDAELCKLFLYLRDNCVVYPGTGLFPRIFLDVMSALRGGKIGDKELYSASFPAMTFPVPNHSTMSVEYTFFVRVPSGLSTGWYDFSTVPTTYTSAEIQLLMEKLRTVLDVVDASTYVSPYKNDMSVFAWNSWKNNHAISTYFPCLYNGTNDTLILERTASLEVPITTPWMAALGFFDIIGSTNIDARTANHSVQVCSSPAAVVWACLSGMSHLAHNVQFKPISSDGIMRRMGAYLAAVDSMSTFSFPSYDVAWMVVSAIMAKLSKYGAAYCNLRTQSGISASQFAVGNVPSMLHTTMKLPWNLMESLNRMVPVIRDGRIYLPCTEATSFTNLVNELPSSSTVDEVITGFGGLDPDNVLTDYRPCWVNMKVGTMLNNMAIVNRNLSQCVRLECFSMYDSRKSALHFTTWRDIDGNYQGVSCAYAYAGTMYRLLGKLELPMIDCSDPHIGAAKYGEPYYVECPDTSYAQLMLAFTNDEVVKPGTLWINAGDLVIAEDGKKFVTQSKKDKDQQYIRNELEKIKKYRHFMFGRKV